MLKFLADGTAVIVLDTPQPDRTDVADQSVHAQVEIARLETELVDEDSVFDAPPSPVSALPENAARQERTQFEQIDALEAQGVLTAEEAAAAKARL